MDSKRCGGVDLHIHSTASDGTFSPNDIIRIAAQIGLDAISITDHDTLTGTRQALQAPFPPDLHFITGIEISAAVPVDSGARGGFHLLGYGIDPENAVLNKTLTRFSAIRDARIHSIVERLNTLGIDLTLAQVNAQVGEGVAGRPHVAAAMIKAGYARDVDDAFDRFLGNDRPAYVGKERLDCCTAIELIANAGGVPVLAHPYLVKHRDPKTFFAFVGQLCEMGLRGIEVYYPQHTREAVARYLSLADQFDLLITGGSDFHGQLMPDVHLGSGRGDLYVPTGLIRCIAVELFAAVHPIEPPAEEERVMNSQALQETLHYAFRDQALLEESLRHSSYVNEHTDGQLRDNERLEFLGDAVLNLVIGDLLMKAYPQMREGDLSRIRANIVNETQLADVARSLGLGHHLLLGKGEIQSNGMDKELAAGQCDGGRHCRHLYRWRV